MSSVKDADGVLTTGARWRWLVPTLLVGAALLVLAPPRAPYIYGSGLSSDMVVEVEKDTRSCFGTHARAVRAGVSTNVLFEAVNDGECSQRRARNRGLAVALLLATVVVMRRRNRDVVADQWGGSAPPMPTATASD